MGTFNNSLSVDLLATLQIYSDFSILFTQYAVYRGICLIVLVELDHKVLIRWKDCCQLYKMTGLLFWNHEQCRGLAASPLGVKWNHFFHNAGHKHPSCHTFTTLKLHSARWLLLKLHLVIQTHTEVLRKKTVQCKQTNKQRNKETHPTTPKIAPNQKNRHFLFHKHCYTL